MEIEHFSGSYHASRPFFVTLSIQKTEGVYEETAFDFHGFCWSVDPSARKAQEFMELFKRFLENPEKVQQAK